MFGWTKREKNEKSQNKATAELKKLSFREKGMKLSRLRKRYPNRRRQSLWDFEDSLFDYDLVLMYLLIFDDSVVDYADLYDNPVEDIVLPFCGEVEEVAVIAEVVEEAVVEEIVEEVAKTTSFDSSTPTESTPETTSFDSNTDTISCGGSEGGCSCDSGDSGGGDCGGD